MSMGRQWTMWTDPKLILLDFFGTLVEYSASRTEQGYPRSYAMLREFGIEDASYEGFLAQWVHTSEEFDRRSEVDDREHSMMDVVTEFLHALLGRDLDANRVAAFTELYVAEWNNARVQVFGSSLPTPTHRATWGHVKSVYR